MENELVVVIVVANPLEAQIANVVRDLPKTKKCSCELTVKALKMAKVAKADSVRSTKKPKALCK